MNFQSIIHSGKSLCLIAAAAVTVACGGGGGGGGTQQTTLALTKVGGDPAPDTVGHVLPMLSVQLKDAGVVKAGTNVVWTTPSGGVVTTPSVTDVNGIATATWTLGHTAGAQTATATVANAAGSPVLFNTTGLPDAASGLVRTAAASGNGQSKPITRVLADLRAQVADQFGNAVPVAGKQVDWTVTGGAAFGTVNPASSMSDAAGIATTTLTLGNTIGPVSITASVAAFSGSDAVFNETARALPPATTNVTAGPGIQFKSDHNNSINPAVDTVRIGGTVSWTGLAGGGHTVVSTGTTTFTNSPPGVFGYTSPVFVNAGSYTYICGVHGSAMSGRIVVE